MDDAKRVLNEVLDYFQETNTSPGGWWAFPDDCSSLCLDFQAEKDPTKFWLDLERDGTVRIIWKPEGGDLKSLTFVHQQRTQTERE